MKNAGVKVIEPFQFNPAHLQHPHKLLIYTKNILVLILQWAILLVISISSLNLNGQVTTLKKQKTPIFQIPEDYLREAENIPAFWVSSVDEVNTFLKNKIRKGKVEMIGKSAGGRPIYAVLYGKARQGKGTSTFSGALGFGDISVYRGPDHKNTVYMGMSGVHGGEFEGIVGTVNLLSVIETGEDLRGRKWPAITASLAKLDRLILVPIVNPDGRARIPLRMEIFREQNGNVHEYLNTGGNADGKITGWPMNKEFIPIDFSKPGFPGGYPNDAGVNIQHDNFFGNPQPETKALYKLTGREKPDLIINMHTGATYMSMLSTYIEPALKPAFDTLYKYVHTGLALNGLRKTKDPQVEAVSRSAPGWLSCYLDGMLEMNCGVLSVVVETPSHGFSGKNGAGETVFHTPGMLLDAQLICHQQAMRFLVETGGRSVWTPDKSRNGNDQGINQHPYFQSPSADINQVIIYGQSLSTGQQTAPVISEKNYKGNLMLGEQVWSNFSNNLDTINLVFKPLIGRPTIGSKKTNAELLADTSINADNQVNCEPPVIGFVNAAKYHLDKYSPGNANKKFAATSSGEGGRSIELLMKNCPNREGKLYSHFVKAANKSKQAADAVNKTINCSAILWMQGEYNYTTSTNQGWQPNTPATKNKTAYKNYFTTLVTDMVADVKNIYQQTRPPVFITYQCGAQYTRDFDIPVGMAQLELANNDPRVVMAGPVYPVTDRGGHLCPNGSRWYGEMMAKVYYKAVIKGEKWSPLQPNTLTRGDDYIEIVFDVPEPPLKLDTLTLQKAKQYGFEIRENGKAKSIKNVLLAGSNTVRLMADTSFIGGMLEVNYAGPATRGNGNLCDSDTFQSFERYKELIAGG
ncbi:MAG: hypothetical protein H7Z13_18445, partial [Ferruginibacter sp.]|nr:hypothetical protein [Ferruginibacter sp.]